VENSLAPFDLTDKVVMITGGGTGVGRATAVLMSAMGANVVVAGRRESLLDETVAEIEAQGGKAAAVITDVRRSAECEALVDRAVAAFGSVDILVNNAGGSKPAKDGTWRDKDWHNMLDLNLTSVWNLSRLTAPLMAERGGGAIVNVSSTASWRAMPNHAPYGAAKAGVNSLTENLAAEYAPQGIRVNGVVLGVVATEGFTKGMELLGRDPEDQADRVLLGRPGRPLEVAYAILFLASRAASFITGEMIHVGGGPRSWSRVESAS
jgi:NAD(P)-dependent dehydrogenase (short-subunit alcohol dehydrogenase family)